MQTHRIVADMRVLVRGRGGMYTTRNTDCVLVVHLFIMDAGPQNCQHFCPHPHRDGVGLSISHFSTFCPSPSGEGGVSTKYNFINIVVYVNMCGEWIGILSHYWHPRISNDTAISLQPFEAKRLSKFD